MMKLNLGCGDQVVEGWVNVDYSLGARLASTPLVGSLARQLGLFRLEWDRRIYIHDLTKPLPWSDGSVDACYTSHTVEHLSRDEGCRLVREAHRVLKPGGILRVVVPDLREIVDRYLSGGLAADHVVEELGVMYGPAKRGVSKWLAPLIEFPHKCMYDQVAMIALLRSAGFSAVARAPFESALLDIRLIEIEGRTQGAVVVEGTKPLNA